MKAKIKRHNLSSEFWTTEECYITEISNSSDDPEVSIARTRVEPGVTTRWHRLKGIGERYYIVSGSGRMEVGDLPPEKVVPGDVVLIPPMCRQRITNIGSKDLIFLAVCTPRFKPESYEELKGD